MRWSLCWSQKCPPKPHSPLWISKKKSMSYLITFTLPCSIMRKIILYRKRKKNTWNTGMLEKCKLATVSVVLSNIADYSYLVWNSQTHSEEISVLSKSYSKQIWKHFISWVNITWDFFRLLIEDSSIRQIALKLNFITALSKETKCGRIEAEGSWLIPI